MAIMTNFNCRGDLREFIEVQIVPFVNKIEKTQHIDEELLRILAENHFFGANIPKKYGGEELNSSALGILHHEVGKSHASIENLLTVVGMASKAIQMGSKKMKTKWLPQIARGESIPAFALTEPLIGSDICNIHTQFLPTAEGYLINGHKKWITLGSRADIFIVFARRGKTTAAFLIPRHTPGLEVQNIQDMLGFRGNMLAEVHFNNCLVPRDSLIGTEGSGIPVVASFALNEGRFTTAWGAVGLAQASLEKTLIHVGARRQFGVPLKDHDIVKQHLAHMVVSLEASRELCKYAGVLRDQGDPMGFRACLIAKYHASKTAARIANKSIQLMGARGCHQEHQVERYFRDSKIFELIEGSSEVLEIEIANLILTEGVADEPL